MKNIKIISLLSLASLAIAVALPAIVRAETLIETETSAGIQADINSSSGSVPQNLRATLKAKIETDAARAKSLREKIELNDERREDRLEDRKDIRLIASTTKIGRKEVRDERKEDMRNASTSAERWGIRREALLESFRVRQTAFVKQLQLSIRNLEQIAVRISGRITLLEQEGKDMSTAKELMVTATTKLDAAKVAVNAVASYSPATTTASTTVTVDLMKPRSIGAEATKAVREARDALKKVVESIILVMGLNMSVTASSTDTQ